ncbi:MBL fold metallo-hydrolase [Acidovorax sp. Leaf160]|uniref:MBL fold metallo-hydrolase n=1 Tax=Acidovorax sp. Leaf160 TaxID=1736280 RepID=UPI0006F4C907|nr:MBL fold metallo-hydrolase [Acidovorax sp. Leaf160]KQR63115.1 MBL fold metallo-hydrolase [Acidovorax sp. Leaf160]
MSPSAPSAASSPAALLPAGITVLERGWLSANNILLTGADDADDAALVDSGYCTHAAQTVALVTASLGGLPLRALVNTHLHSDHCGGNAALQAAFPALRTLVPPGQAAHVRDWNPDALSYTPTGQDCPPFRLDGVLQPGSSVRLGGRDWQVHAAPGHDTHSVVLFEPEHAVLISADALWENGFGVVFPELEGEHAFAEVAATLDRIEALAPRIVIPGHGPVFTDVAQALATARRRLDGFVRAPDRHALYAAKVLLKYKLLEWQRAPLAQVQGWAAATPYFGMLHARYFAGTPFDGWAESLVQALEASGAARREGAWLHNA